MKTKILKTAQAYNEACEIIGNKEVNLEPEKRDKLLSITATKNYFLSSKAAMF